MKKKAFVLMPFEQSNDEIYQQFIKSTFEGFGIECSRADERIDLTGEILAGVIRMIGDADIVIAELTGYNPNVIYELALAHALNKPTIMISRNLEDVPFDLMGFRVRIYENNAKGLIYLQSQLKSMLALFERGQLVSENPVARLESNPFVSVYRTHEVLNFEGKATTRVCVIAPNIELGPSTFANVMKTNLLRGIRYQYLLADEPNVVNDFRQFVDDLELGDAEKNFIGKLIDRDMVESDVTLIDPGTQDEYGFILAPAERPDMHFRLISSSLHRMKERFNRLWFKARDAT